MLILNSCDYWKCLSPQHEDALLRHTVEKDTICSFVFFISLFHIARSGHFVIKPSWKCKLDSETTEIKPSSRCGEQQRLRWELFSFPGCCCCISPCPCWCCRWCFCFLTEFRVINHSFAASVPPPAKTKTKRKQAASPTLARTVIALKAAHLCCLSCRIWTRNRAALDVL